MLELPADGMTDPLKLADRLELLALTVPDGNASQGDLESALRKASLAEVFSSDDIERKTLEVLYEIELRIDATGEPYPFNLQPRGVLQLKSDDWTDFPVYTFCLCISYYGFPSGDIGPKLFEELSSIAAGSYLGGTAMRFGFPRSDLPSSFGEAVTTICEHVGEGDKFKPHPTRTDIKDDRVDVIAWKDFLDEQPSKVIMFGQCAAGRDWDREKFDLDPENFCDQWMTDAIISPGPLKSFFCPHRIAHSDWDFIARRAGIFFDRCRISYWAQQENIDFSPYIEWVKDKLAKST